MQEIYSEPIKPELIGERIREINDAGRRVVRVGHARSAPRRSPRPILDAELDLLVIQGTVVSAEHVSKTVEPLNLKRFVRELDIPVIVGGCACYQAALHLMRTGAAGVLVGVGPGHACTTRGVLGIGVPQATAIADAAGRPHAPPRRDRRVRARHRRRRHEHRWRHRQGHRLRRRRGDDRLAARGRRRGARAGLPLGHGHLPPDAAARRPGADRATRGTLEEILVGPAHENDGRLNLFGALRTSMATCGYETVKEFQKAEVMVAPALQTEGKSLQKSQGVGDGRTEPGSAGIPTLDRLTDDRRPTPSTPSSSSTSARQYAQLIARRVREAHVYSEIVPHTITAAEIAGAQPAGVILSRRPEVGPRRGRARASTRRLRPRRARSSASATAPSSSACSSAARWRRTGRGEYGRTELASSTPASALFGDGCPASRTVWMSHFDSITRAPDGLHGHRAAPPTRRSRRSSTRRAAALRRAVPPRGRAHAARPGDARALPVRRRAGAARRGR